MLELGIVSISICAVLLIVRLRKDSVHTLNAILTWERRGYLQGGFSTNDSTLRAFWDKWRQLRVSRGEQRSRILEDFARLDVNGSTLPSEEYTTQLIQFWERYFELSLPTISLLSITDNELTVLASSSNSERYRRILTDGLTFKATLESSARFSQVSYVEKRLELFNIRFESLAAYTKNGCGVLLHLGFPTSPDRDRLEGELFQKFAERSLGLLTQLREIKEQQREDNLSREALVSLSHDLRHPSISALSMIQDFRASGDLKRIDSLESVIREQLELLGDLLDLEKNRIGALQSRPSVVSLAELAQRLIESTYENWRVTTQLKTPPQIFVDERQLHRILANLLSNALKATVTEHVALSGVHTLEGGYQISVLDTGPGINKELRAQLFSPITTSSSHFSSCGLGLSICKLLADKNGLSLQYASNPAGGSIFSVLMPKSLVVLDHNTPQTIQNRALKTPESNSIIIAEDDDATARCYIRTFESLGFQTTRVRSRAELGAILTRPPTNYLLCTDINLLDGRAEETLCNFGQLHGLPRTIIITGEDEQNEELKRLGARFLQKPVDSASLTRVAKEVLSIQ